MCALSPLSACSTHVRFFFAPNPSQRWEIVALEVLKPGRLESGP